MLRVEVYEKYPIDGDISPDYWANLKIKPPPESYSYRRTMPLIDTIERPIEIPGSEDEFIIRFWTGEDMICKGDYDEFCILLNDIESDLIFDDENKEI